MVLTTRYQAPLAPWQGELRGEGLLLMTVVAAGLPVVMTPYATEPLMTDLAQSQKGPTACRRVEMHFTGGLRGSNWEPGELVIWLYNGPQRLLVGDIPEGQIQRAISSLGLLCIGIDEVLEEPHLVMRCPGCDHENPEVARYCAACGAHLTASCPHCQRRNSR